MAVCIIKPTEKPVIFICYNYKYFFSDGNIYTYTLFYRCSKKVCNSSKHIVFPEVIAIRVIIQSAPIALID